MTELEKLDAKREEDLKAISATMLRPQKERLDAIDAEISGVHSQYGITSFDLGLMRTLRGQSFRSDAQEKYLELIEIKVFGHSRKFMDSK